MRVVDILVYIIISFCYVQNGFAQIDRRVDVRGKLTSTHFKLYEQPVSTQKLDGFMRFYSSIGDKEYAYGVIIDNMINHKQIGAPQEMVYLKNMNVPIPDVRVNYSERLYGMMFNLIAWQSMKNEQMATISMIQLFSIYGEYLPKGLPDNDFTSMNNSCDFVTNSCSVYNSWAMNNRDEVAKFVALHETFYLEWKASNEDGSYQKFSTSMESWVKANTPFEFVTPSQINTCKEFKQTGKLIFNETELKDNSRTYIVKLYRALLNRSPRSLELNYFIKTIQNGELDLSDLLFLILTSKEYKGEFL
ncbi:MAG: hypothetical protein ACI85Q_001550 [Salibacteraceae bacterium]|jgi:hypothetical protein